MFCGTYDYRSDLKKPNINVDPLNISRSIVRTTAIAIGNLLVAMMYKIAVSISYCCGMMTY